MTSPDLTARPPARETPAAEPTLLALDAGVWETGWAIYRGRAAGETGAIRLPRGRRLYASERVAHLVGSLDCLVVRWRPTVVAYGQPSGIRWPAPALELLDAALMHWSARHRLPLYTYAAQDVRDALARRTHVPPDQLAFAVMLRLGLIGARKSTREWDALAVGYYHLWSTRRQLPQQ